MQSFFPLRKRPKSGSSSSLSPNESALAGGRSQTESLTNGLVDCAAAEGVVVEVRRSCESMFDERVSWACSTV